MEERIERWKERRRDGNKERGKKGKEEGRKERGKDATLYPPSYLHSDGDNSLGTRFGERERGKKEEEGVEGGR